MTEIGTAFVMGVKVSIKYKERPPFSFYGTIYLTLNKLFGEFFKQYQILYLINTEMKALKTREALEYLRTCKEVKLNQSIEDLKGNIIEVML